MRRLTVLAAGALLIAACDSGGGSQLDTVAPASSAPEPLPTLPATSPPTTVALTAPAATLPAGVVGLSADGPWKLVDSAPGVTTPGLVYELMPGLWAYLPVVEDVANGITWTLNEEDRPIIEAYLQAKLVYFEAATRSPIDLNHPGWTEWFDGADAPIRAGLEVRSQQGQVVDLDVGVVLRPQVIGDDRTEVMAIVFDCVLDGSYFVMPDGSLAEGSTYGIVESGGAYRLKVGSQHWVVTETGRQPTACD